MSDRIGGSARPMTALGRPPSSSGRYSGAAPPSTAAPGGRPSTAQGQRPSTGMRGRPASSMSIQAGHFFEWAENTKDNVAPSKSYISSATPAGRSRIGSAAPMAAPRTGMNRPGSRVGSAVPNISARPVTQQGLAGVRPGTGRMNRQVADKSYFMGLLRSKISELNAEIHSMNKDIDYNNKERQNFNVYEQKAETLAVELKDLQGNLADFNMMQDKLNTNTDIGLMTEELHMLKLRNDEEALAVDALFGDRRQKEDLARKIEGDVEMERQAADTMLSNMTEETRDSYEQLKQDNEQLVEDLRLKQEELYDLEANKSQLEDEMAVSKIKQEAMILHEKLAEAEAKKSAIEAEMDIEGTPEEQRDKFISRVKKGNEEVFTMDKHASDVRERMEQCHEELRELEDEYQDQQGEKNQKYRELRLKEQQIDEFLSTFDQSEQEETARIEELHSQIVSLLVKASKNSAGIAASPRNHPKEHKLDTVDDLKEEHVRLQDEIGHLEELEIKNVEEMGALKTKTHQMELEIDKFTDLDSLKTEIQLKEKNLEAEQKEIEDRLVEAKDNYAKMQQQVDGLRRQLDQNDTHLQLLNMEKKLQYIEQNNFALREIIDSRNAETNVGPVKEQVMNLIAEYNNLLITSTNKRTLLA